MRRIVLIAVLFSGIITACSKQEIITNYVTHEETQSIFEGIAEYVNSSVDLSACKKIKAQIDDVVPLGGEEGVLISDMLDNNFINPSALSRALIQTNSVPSTRSESDIIQYIIDNNIQVYWPYSENWDGQTLPTITFTPEDENQIWNWGYVRNENERGDISYDKIYVDEQYAENNPVWVIDKRDMPDVLTSPCIQTRSSEFHPWILKEIQVKHQYDSWLQGASNFKITIGFPKMEGYAGGANMISFKVTRKQIRKEKWVELNRILNDDWSEDQLSNSMFMVETDGGKTVSATIGSSYKADNNLTINTSTTVSYKDDDDIVHKWEYKRSVMAASTMDKIWLSSDGYVNFKMIIE